MRPAATSVDAYMAELPLEQRKALEALRKVIRAAAPKAEELISYSMPMYKQDGQVVAFAAFKNHLSLFVCSGSFLGRFPVDKKKYNVQRSSLHFTPEKPLPATLVKRIVKARLAENAAKVVAKRKKIVGKR